MTPAAVERSPEAPGCHNSRGFSGTPRIPPRYPLEDAVSAGIFAKTQRVPDGRHSRVLREAAGDEAAAGGWSRPQRLAEADA